MRGRERERKRQKERVGKRERGGERESYLIEKRYCKRMFCKKQVSKITDQDVLIPFLVTIVTPR